MTGGGNVTALASYYAGNGRSVLVSGHADGTVRLHSISFASARLVSFLQCCSSRMPAPDACRWAKGKPCCCRGSIARRRARRQEAAKTEVVGIEPPRPLVARPPNRPPPVLVNGALPGTAPQLQLQQQQQPVHSGTQQEESATGQQAATGSSAQDDPIVCAAASSNTACPAPELRPAQQWSCPCGLVQGQQLDVTAAAAGSDAEPQLNRADLQSGDGGSAVTHLLTQRFKPRRQIATIRADGSIHVWREDGECASV